MAAESGIVGSDSAVPIKCRHYSGHYEKRKIRADEDGLARRLALRWTPSASGCFRRRSDVARCGPTMRREAVSRFNRLVWRNSDRRRRRSEKAGGGLGYFIVEM